MARYLGPKLKLSRREGTDLSLKSGVRHRLQVQDRVRRDSTASVEAACQITRSITRKAESSPNLWRAGKAVP